MSLTSSLLGPFHSPVMHMRLERSTGCAGRSRSTIHPHLRACQAMTTTVREWFDDPDEGLIQAHSQCHCVGEMSAWAAFGLLGLYPLAGTETYVLGVPSFANATLALPASAWRHDGGTAASQAAARDASVSLLSIIAHNFSSINIWAYRATINGVPLATPFVNHSQLLPAALRARYGAIQGAASESSSAVAPSLLEFWLTDHEQTWGL